MHAPLHISLILTLEGHGYEPWGSLETDRVETLDLLRAILLVVQSDHA
jgi:hypothetical protein